MGVLQGRATTLLAVVATIGLLAAAFVTLTATVGGADATAAAGTLGVVAVGVAAVLAAGLLWRARGTTPYW